MNRPDDKDAPSSNNRQPQSSKAGAPSHAPKRAVKISKRITETYLHNSGLYYLQRYATTVAQFRKIMLRKIDNSCRHHPDQDREVCVLLLDALIEKFVRAGLLNDDGFARGSVISLRRRGLSQRMILMKLQNKGLSETQIKAALASFNDENETDAKSLELEGAMKLARKKKVGPYSNGATYDRNKALGAFARAGFSMDVIRQVLAMDSDDIEPID